MNRPLQFPIYDNTDLMILDVLSLFFRPVPRPEGPVVLRTPCKPDEPVNGTGFHKHLCQCGTAWKHDDLTPLMCDTHEQFLESHTCPSCGTEVTEKHFD